MFRLVQMFTIYLSQTANNPTSDQLTYREEIIFMILLIHLQITEIILPYKPDKLRNLVPPRSNLKSMCYSIK